MGSMREGTGSGKEFKREEKNSAQGQSSASSMLCTNSCVEEHPRHARYANRLESDYS